MLKGRGRQFAILGGLATLVVVASLALGVAYEPKCAADSLAAENPEAHNEQRPGYEGKVTCEGDCVVTFSAAKDHCVAGEDYAADSDASAKPPEQRSLPPVEERDLCAQARMAWWTRLIAAWTAIGAVLLFFALLATLSEIEETRRIGQAQVRAYLSVSKACIWLGNDAFWIELSIYNCGQSPAHNVIIEVEHEIYVLPDFHFGEKVSPASYWPETRKITSIAAQEEGRMVGYSSGNLSEPILRAIYTFQGIQIEVAGVIRWQDVFGNSDSLEFSFFDTSVSEHNLIEDREEGGRRVKPLILTPGHLPWNEPEKHQATE